MPGSDEQLEVTLESLNAEARKWRRLADEMASVKTDVGRLALYPSAFFFADVVSVAEHSATYNAFHSWFVQLLADAATEFNQIAGALDKSAEAYADADTRSSVDLKSIYGTRPE